MGICSRRYMPSAADNMCTVCVLFFTVLVKRYRSISAYTVCPHPLPYVADVLCSSHRMHGPSLKGTMLAYRLTDTHPTV